jgi:hypothetical protein
MARDLIPPPSPAGRPQTPDGTPNLIELPPDPLPPGAVPVDAGPPPGPSEFRNRFGFLLGALAGVFIAAALAAAIVIATSSSDGNDEGLSANWSKWQPSDNSIEAGAAEIAQYVGGQYKHPDGKQLADVSGGEFPNGPQLVLRPSSGPIVHIDGTRVLYQLNGLGPNDTIKGGTPSTTRGAVIQREGLELALYTFRYLPDADSVVVMLPKSPPTKEQQAAMTALASGATKTVPDSLDPDKLPPKPALFYRPGDLKQQLQMPLGNTLAPTAPSTDDYTGPEAKTVATLTTSNLFTVSGDGQTVVYLDRPDTP